MSNSKENDKNDKNESELISNANMAEWFGLLKKFSPTHWDQLPELDLYMDQVVTLLNRQLSAFSKQGENLLTPSMVNNYVKDGVLPRPDKKKYNKEHLAMLMMICSLKSVLSLPEIHTLLDGFNNKNEVDDFYSVFLEIIGETHSNILDRLDKQINMSEKNELYMLALTLSLEANIRQIIASKILINIMEEQKQA